MIDVFERLAPAYGRVVRKFAIDVWYDRADADDFLRKADYFRRRYARDLTKYFQKQGYRYSPKRIEELAQQWLADQVITARKIKTLSNLKKGKLARELDEITRNDVEELTIKREQRPEGKVSPVLSFADNLSAVSIQIGEDAAFELGRNINSDTVSHNSETYEWTSQQDSHVRETHRKLARKIFSYNSPPTTIDKYGRRHTGNCGTDWGCRCYEVAKKGKPLLNYVVTA